jgi:hypothetical protein
MPYAPKPHHSLGPRLTGAARASRYSVVGLLVLTLLSPLAVTAPAGGDGAPRWLGAELVSTITGPDSTNRTDERWGVYGTDLGHMFEHRGRVYLVFGDTYGTDRSDWRSNTMAWTEDPDPSDGLELAGMVEDWPGHAGELLSSRKLYGWERTVIPTYGVSVGERMYLHYMSVRYWGSDGRWRLGHSGLAYSDDDGRTWIKDRDAVWPGGGDFGQVSFVRQGGHVYLFGIPAGRFGEVTLARVREDRLLDLPAYEYWTSQSWSADSADSATVAPAPVGELSVRWNSFYGKWLMMHLDERRRAIVLRTADRLTGPWSRPHIVTTAAEHARLYAPYIAPLWGDSPEVYFTMSTYEPYAVHLMRTTLPESAAGGRRFALLLASPDVVPRSRRSRGADLRFRRRL